MTAFIYRAALKLNLPPGRPRKPRRNEEEMEAGHVKDDFLTNFSDLIMRTPPQAPPNLFKTGTVRRGDGHGKVNYIIVNVLYFIIIIFLYYFIDIKLSMSFIHCTSH